MGFDLAPNFLIYLLFHFLELFYLLIPIIVYFFQKKDIKFEIKNTLYPLKRTTKRRIFDIGLGIFFGIALYLFGGFILDIIYNIIPFFFGDSFFNIAVQGSVNTSPPSYTLVELILSIFLTFLIVGFSEEFFYRGILLNRLGKQKLSLGVFGSSFLFALYHVFPGVVLWETFITFWSYYFLIGILLGLLAIHQKKDLLSCIFAHGTFNLIVLLFQ